jgi:predicted CXXCH cytochrome family protein
VTGGVATRSMLGIAVAAAIFALSIGTAQARGGAYRASPHGSPATGVQRWPGAPRGACAQCHFAGGSSRTQDKDARHGGAGLFGPNDNGLCFSCHRGTDARSRFPTSSGYAQSSHGESPSMIWPGPAPLAREGSDAGRCVNCHDPHGAKDAAGVVPSMLIVRGDALCLRCHDGNRTSANVAADFVKPYRHGERRGVSGDEEVGCSACHDPHRAGAAAGSCFALVASPALAGARRVRISNGPAGSAPFLEEAPRDAGPFAAEFELCLRCHSAFGGRTGRADLATLLNPENRSFHPVEAQGRNLEIHPEAFTRGWRADRLVRCSDCHASDEPGRRGTHGSRYAYLLKKPYEATTARAGTSEGDLCFDCHAFATYARPGSANVHTRFAGHAAHAGRQIGCFACHDTHGSAAQPALLALRPDGIAAYAQLADGGTCTTSCHATTASSTKYPAQYPR